MSNTTAQTSDAATNPEIGFIALDEQIALRRMVTRNPQAESAVILLHGFPETIAAWGEVAPHLTDAFEVHAFDWPGFGRSSRPPTEHFSYAPAAYARVLKAYIERAGIDRTKLIIYATDIGCLPVLLLALAEPDIARSIIVGDFAPFNRPAHMYPSLQALKSPATAGAVRAQMNANRDEILENSFRRGLPEAAWPRLSQAFKTDIAQGWDHGGMTSADAFHHYYAHFTRDQNLLEANSARFRTPMKAIWGEHDPYIDKAMGAEFSSRFGVELKVLPGVGHYPHLQVPEQVREEIRAIAR